MGKGATFKMELPIGTRSSAKGHHVTSGSSSSRIRKTCVGILVDFLTGSGYEIAEAARRPGGRGEGEFETPDLILADIQLPILDGYETTRQIKADPSLMAAPIIAVVQVDVARAQARLCSARAYLLDTLGSIYAQAQDTAVSQQETS